MESLNISLLVIDYLKVVLKSPIILRSKRNLKTEDFLWQFSRTKVRDTDSYLSTDSIKYDFD